MTLEQLNQSFALDNELTFVLGKGDRPQIEIQNKKAKAVISLYAGQILSFQPNQGDELLFISDSAYFETGKAIKGGAPICWPWFGPDPRGQGGPSHGFVRNRPWNVLSTASTASGETRVKLELKDTPETQAIWPHSFQVVIEILVGETLTLSLITQNTGNQAFEITQALHTYFKVGDIKQVSVQGLDGCPYLDKVDGGAEKQQTGEITISEEVDRVYTNVPARLVIDDAALGRQIQIQSTGSKTAIVWNPWSEISAKMADLGDQDYERFVCVETANAADDIITVQPGETVQLTAQYSIEP